MGWRRRVGTLGLLAGGAALLGLMAFVVALDPSWGTRREVVETSDEVAVFLPSTSDWADFRGGVEACLDRGLGRLVSEGTDFLLVSTPRAGRLVRFLWRDEAGVEAVRDEVAHQLALPRPPLAFVGSSNTVLTAALADALQREVLLAKLSPPSPVLLVPWATSSAIDRPGEQGKRVPLLAIYRDRSFRFCPDNRALAALVAGCVAGRPKGATPGRVIVLVDRHDPYSRDLGTAFLDVVKSIAPDADVRLTETELSNAAGHGGQAASHAERREAAGIARMVAEHGPTEARPTWVVLPLQGNPTRRMLEALQEREALAEATQRGALEIVCGDGIGEETLRALAASTALRVWCASSGQITGEARSLPGGVLLSAEIAAAVLAALDHDGQAPVERDLREQLGRLDFPADDARGLGRSLAFEPSGERRGTDLGCVLAIAPGVRELLGYELDAHGDWTGPIALGEERVVGAGAPLRAGPKP